MSDINYSFIEIIGEHFKREIMVPQIAREVSKVPEGISVSLKVSIHEGSP